MSQESVSTSRYKPTEAELLAVRRLIWQHPALEPLRSVFFKLINETVVLEADLKSLAESHKAACAEVALKEKEIDKLKAKVASLETLIDYLRERIAELEAKVY